MHLNVINMTNTKILYAPFYATKAGRFGSDMKIIIAYTSISPKVPPPKKPWFFSTASKILEMLHL